MNDISNHTPEQAELAAEVTDGLSNDALGDEALDRAEKPSSCVCGGLCGRMTLTRHDGE